MNEAIDFLQSIDDADQSSVVRAIALLWFVGRDDPAEGLSTLQICKLIEGAGHPKQNVSRLKWQLAKQRKFVSQIPGRADAWRLIPAARKDLDSRYAAASKAERKIVPTDSVLPASLFRDTRGYIERVVFQINGSYDFKLYDCTAVMCRRLLETLIIEVYEAAGRSLEIKGHDGNFFMFSDLLKILENDGAFSLSRNALQGLRDFKRIGDLSAHNRRFNARHEDINRIRDGLRVAAEELLHLAKLV